MHLKLSLLILGCLLVFNTIAKTADEYRQSITVMMLDGNISGWKHLIHELEAENQNREMVDLLLSAQYGLMGYLMATEDYSNGLQIINDFDRNLQNAHNENDATIIAYQSAIDGFRMAMKGSKSIKLSSIRNSKIENALQLEPENTTALFVFGNILFFAPERMGGNQKQALKEYEKSFDLLKLKPTKDWIYYGTGAWLVRVYYHFDMLKECRAMCELLLRDAPEFKLVKEELYPVVKQTEFDKKWEQFLKDAGDD